MTQTSPPVTESMVSGVAGDGVGVGVGAGSGVVAGVEVGVGVAAGIGDGVDVGVGVGTGVSPGISATVPIGGATVSVGSALEPQPASMADIRRPTAISKTIRRYINYLPSIKVILAGSGDDYNKQPPGRVSPR
jgi:hypothetical protein